MCTSEAPICSRDRDVTRLACDCSMVMGLNIHLSSKENQFTRSVLTFKLNRVDLFLDIEAEEYVVMYGFTLSFGFDEILHVWYHLWILQFSSRHLYISRVTITSCSAPWKKMVEKHLLIFSPTFCVKKINFCPHLYHFCLDLVTSSKITLYARYFTDIYHVLTISPVY